MKLNNYRALHHPLLQETFILRKNKIKEWIEKNEQIWEKYNIDPDLFIVEVVFIKDGSLIDVFKENAPEYLL